MRRLHVGLAIAGVAITLLTCPLSSARATQAVGPIARPIEDLELTRDWTVEVDGHPVAGSSVYYSAYDVAWLVTAPTIEPLLVRARTMSVRRVSGEGESGRAISSDARSAVAPNDLREVVTDLTRDGEAYRFVIGGRVFQVVPAPPLLGPQTQRTVAARHLGLARERAAYAASSRMVEPAFPAAGGGERVAEETIVRVYFGSWSPACLRLVPRLAAVEEAWKERGLRFEYYGLPQPLTDDPQAVADGIVGVPTVVVKRAGNELGRLSGRRLDHPATGLSRILAGQGK